MVNDIDHLFAELGAVLAGSLFSVRNGGVQHSDKRMSI